MEKKQNPFKNAYWRYQVINAGTKKKPILNIHEVWINRKTGKIFTYTEGAENINEWDNMDDLIGTLKNIIKDCKKYPVLTTKEIDKMILNK